MQSKKNSEELLQKELAELRRRISDLKQAEITLEETKDKLQSSEREFKDIIESALEWVWSEPALEKATEKLHESEKRFKDIADHALEWIWEFNVSGQFAFTNSAVERILGYKSGDILKRHFYELFHPQDRVELKKTFFGFILNNQSFNQIECRNIHHNGQEVWLSMSGLPMLDKQGNLVGYRGLAYDITERKRSVTRHKELEQKLKFVLDNLPMGIIVGNPDEGTADINPELWKILTQGSPEKSASTFQRPGTGSDTSLPQNHDDGMAKGLELHTSDAEDRLVRGSITTSSQKTESGATHQLSILQGDTGSRRYEERIVRQDRLLEAINRISGEALNCETYEDAALTCLAIAGELTGSEFGYLGHVNDDGNIDGISLTKPGWDSFKMPKSKLIGNIENAEPEGIWGNIITEGLPLVLNNAASQPQRVLVPGDHPPLSCFMGVPLKQAGKTIGLVCMANKASGYGFADQRELEILSSAITTALQLKRKDQDLNQYRKRFEELVDTRTADLSNTILKLQTEIMHHSMDSETLKKKTAALESSNTELQQFAGIASHDLQEPLRVVASYAKLLAKRFESRLDEKSEKYIEYIVSGTERMQRLLSDLLAFSQVGTSDKPPEPVDCGTALDHALANLEIAIKDNKAKITHDPLPEVLANSSLLTQVFQNLIDNAIKFCNKKKPEIHIGVKKADGQWVFSVEDNGIGIDPEFADKIFDVFHRLHEQGKYPGSGIGLAIAKKIVERHGGRIWLDKSSLEQGSTFCFSLKTANND